MNQRGTCQNIAESEHLHSIVAPLQIEHTKSCPSLPRACLHDFSHASLGPAVEGEGDVLQDISRQIPVSRAEILNLDLRAIVQPATLHTDQDLEEEARAVEHGKELLCLKKTKQPLHTQQEVPNF